MGNKKRKDKNEIKERRSVNSLQRLNELIPCENEVIDEIPKVKIDYQDHFINPYTFLPIQNKEPERKTVERGELTGMLECSLEVKSPIFIPNTTKDFNTTLKEKAEDSEKEKTINHSFQEFYSYEDLSKKEDDEECKPENPILPGSEIRGMVRNIYEQLTNSCFLEVDETNLPYKRTPQPKEAAVMMFEHESDKWWLYLDPDIQKVSQGQCKKDRLQQGDCGRVSGREGTFRKEDNGSYILHLTGDIKGKKNAIAFHKVQEGKKEEVQRDALLRLHRVVESYCDEKVNKKGEYDIYKAYGKRLDEKKPVFVYMDSTHTYLSPSCMTKEFFENSIESILEKQSMHNPCRDVNHACPGCRLFGMVGDQSAIAGRLRFMDSHESKDIVFSPKTILPILGKPQISATEFYLKKPPCKDPKEIDMWNYDYYSQNKIGSDNRKATGKEIRVPYTTELMGRKVYWHGAYKGIEDTGEKCLDKEKREMAVSVRPIVGGAFQFKIQFQDITAEELENLIFCLTLNGKGIHKIGKGKPIGMGDCKISIDKLSFRKYAMEKGQINIINTEDDSYKEGKKKETEVVKQILKYTSYLNQEEKAIVAYPSVKPSNDKMYKWFGENRGSVKQPKIKQVLPNILDNNKMLRRER